jgi:hypothetical protein
VISPVVAGKTNDIGLIDEKLGVSRSLGGLVFDFSKSLNVEFEDGDHLVFGEEVIVKIQVHSGFDRFVKNARPIRGEEQNTVVVFKHSQKH